MADGIGCVVTMREGQLAEFGIQVHVLWTKMYMDTFHFIQNLALVMSPNTHVQQFQNAILTSYTLVLCYYCLTKQTRMCLFSFALFHANIPFAKCLQHLSSSTLLSCVIYLQT